MHRPFRKKLNPRLIEKCRCYSVEDLSEVFDVGHSTVLGWITKDLKTIDQQKPYLMFGADITAWIKSYHPTKKKKPDQRKIHCLKCRDKVLFDYQNAWIETGKKGFKFVQCRCPTCKSLVNRFGEKYIDIFQREQKGLTGSIHPPLKQTFMKEENNAPIQPKERAYQIPLF